MSLQLVAFASWDICRLSRSTSLCGTFVASVDRLYFARLIVASATWNLCSLPVSGPTIFMETGLEVALFNCWAARIFSLHLFRLLLFRAFAFSGHCPQRHTSFNVELRLPQYTPYKNFQMRDCALAGARALEERQQLKL